MSKVDEFVYNEENHRSVLKTYRKIEWENTVKSRCFWVGRLLIANGRYY